MKTNLLIASLISSLVCIFIAGCGSSGSDSIILEPSESWDKPVVENLIIPEQSDGEVKVAENIHPAMDSDLKEYIHKHVFWAGGYSVLLTYVFSDVSVNWDERTDKPITESESQKLKYIWLNPVNIAPEFYYPADAICLSNAGEHCFSSQTCHFLDRGKTDILMPYSVSIRNYSPDFSQILKPYDVAYMNNPKISATPSFVDGVEGLAHTDENIGFLFELKDEKVMNKTYKLWYTGPIDNDILPDDIKSREDLRATQTRSHKFAGEKVYDVRYMPDVDIIIVPIAQPSKISPKKLDRLARYLNAKAIYFVGLDLMEKDSKEKYIDLMTNNAKTPIWIPDLAKTQK